MAQSLTRRVARLQFLADKCPPTALEFDKRCPIQRLITIFWLTSAWLMLGTSCRIHPLEDGVYRVSLGEILRDDCGLATGEVLSTGVLDTEGNAVELTLTKPSLRLVGIYRDGVEEMTLDGSISNSTSIVRGRECLLDTISLHLDATTIDSSSFGGAMSISYEARQPDECTCRLWFKYEATKQ